MLEVPAIVTRAVSMASGRAACAPPAERAPTHPASARLVRRAERTCLRSITVPFRKPVNVNAVCRAKRQRPCRQAVVKLQGNSAILGLPDLGGGDFSAGTEF